MNLKYISVSMANCYFAEPHGMTLLHPFLYAIDFKRALSFGVAHEWRCKPVLLSLLDCYLTIPCFAIRSESHCAACIFVPSAGADDVSHGMFVP